MDIIWSKTMHTKQKPYLRLWAAVLEQAIKDLKPNYNRENRTTDYNYGYGDTVRQEAIDWFKSDRDKVKSFIWICRELGYNPDFIRGLVFRGQ